MPILNDCQLRKNPALHNPTGCNAQMHPCLNRLPHPSAFVSYAGPFTSRFRSSLISEWIKFLADKGVPMTEGIKGGCKRAAVLLWCAGSSVPSKAYLPGLLTVTLGPGLSTLRCPSVRVTPPPTPRPPVPAG